jgi:phytanoyl-CoA hydroxylase
MVMGKSQKSELLRQFAEEGYAIARSVLNPCEDLQPVIEEYGAAADRLAEKCLVEGAISSYNRHCSEEDRLLQLMRQTDGRCFQFLDITLPVEDQILDDTPMHLGPNVFGLLRNARLLDCIEDFIGPEIYCVPVQHMRIKPPEVQISDKTQSHTLTLTARTSWHQDLIVVTDDADETNMLGVWLPLNDATVENGCLVVVPGSHKRGLVRHCDTPTFQGIPNELVGNNQRPLPVKPGDVIFLHPLIMHASLSNSSNGARWSFDLRYCPTGQPTGRKWFPGFVARSRAYPESELTDPQVWAEAWHAARASLAGRPRPNFHHESEQALGSARNSMR